MFADNPLRIPTAHCRTLAIDAVTFVWEECKFGRLVAEDQQTFWKYVSEQLYKSRNHWRTKDKEMSMDAEVFLEGPATGHDFGLNGYQPPDQIDCCYLSEVRGGIELLPRKHASVMRLIAYGSNALDISTELHIPVHTIFRLIREARRFLFDRELIAMAKDNRRHAD
jgi:hypothetical protein